MSMDFSQFHFIRPWLLLALPALMLVWYFSKDALKNNQWENVISKEMLSALQVDQSTTSSRWQWLLIAAWVLAVFAIAGPSWIKTPLPAFQNQKALVIALDLSPSMLATDLNPDRLTRAKFKLIDMLRQQSDGQVALIAYAGDAHTVSPLTDDPRTIEALLPALHPNIMPSQGSNVEQAVALAQQLLIDAQASDGDILLITDGITLEAQRAIKKQLKPSLSTPGNTRNKLSILGVGSTQPAPIPQPEGGFLRRANGEIVLSGVNNTELSNLAALHEGQFASLSNDDSDIQRLLRDGFESSDDVNQTQSQNVFYDSWEDMGHWLVLLLLPLAAFCFRKGLIYMLPLMFMLPIESEAQSLEDFSWADLWRTRDQQGQDLVNKKEYAQAAEKFKRQDLAGAANHNAGNFKPAQEQFSNSDGIDNLYNKGVAQAFNNDLDDALETFDKVLAQQADYADALHNKEIVKQLLEQQQEQQDQNQEGEDQQNQDQQEENQDSSESSDSDQSEQQDQESSEDQQQSDSEQNQEQDQEQEQEKSEQANESEEEQEAKQEESELAANEQPKEPQAQIAEQTDEPLKDASEQWLRAIADDPSRLLRNKFQYQAQQRTIKQRRSNNNQNNNQNNNSTEKRY